MRIGLDVMGGDFAPEACLSGALLAREELGSEHTIVLIGEQDQIQDWFEKKEKSLNGFEIVHAPQVIGMGENPAKAFANKPESGISLGFTHQMQGRIDGFASAGNTGAMLVGAHVTVKTISGIIRPAIATTLPSINGPGNIILDIGLNPDCRPDVLYQYGIIGSLYARHVCGFTNPRVGLLNIGSEDSKGNLVARSAFELMSGTRDFAFVGNVEGNELFSNEKADVIVCDGFVGNVVIKEAEALYSIYRNRDIEDAFFEQFNFENYGGTPVLGINGNVLIGHGRSSALAIKNMLIHGLEVMQANLTGKIKEAFR